MSRKYTVITAPRWLRKKWQAQATRTRKRNVRRKLVTCKENLVRCEGTQDRLWRVWKKTRPVPCVPSAASSVRDTSSPSSIWHDQEEDSEVGTNPSHREDKERQELRSEIESQGVQTYRHQSAAQLRELRDRLTRRKSSGERFRRRLRTNPEVLVVRNPRRSVRKYGLGSFLTVKRRGSMAKKRRRRSAWSRLVKKWGVKGAKRRYHKRRARKTRCKRRRSHRRKRSRNSKLTVRYRGRKRTFRGLQKRYGMRRAKKIWRKGKKYHGGRRIRC